MNHLHSVSSFLTELQSGIQAGYEDFSFSFSNIESIFPNVAVPISGIMDYYREKGNVEFIEIDIPPIIDKTRIFNPIDCNTEFNDYSWDPLNKVWRFNDYDHVFKLVNFFIDEISKLDVFEEGVLTSLDWSLNEIMDNVIQHSETNSGYIMGQIHRINKHIAFCIFDTGQGIYNSLKNSQHRPKHPIDALTLCIKEGVTRDKEIGQGNGMYGLSEIIRLNKGLLNITSNKASLQIYSNNIKTIKNLPTISFKNGCTSVDFQLDYQNKVSLEQVLKLGSTTSYITFKADELMNEKGEVDYLIKNKAQGFGTRKSGLKVRNEIINLFNETSQPINIDFKGVNLISSSFADELLGKLVVHFGFFGFNNVIRLKNMNQLVQAVAQRSVAQRMAETK